ncbi:hypothetical protein [Nocardioides ochotonae]|uniref:hypothetical protein n=1 Tax=Nocardioides ochotonae TaxID=2685869 RepID=UPI00140C29F3|nr:hypothetical protein [Nocardioides ochotonae]
MSAPERLARPAAPPATPQAPRAPREPRRPLLAEVVVPGIVAALVGGLVVGLGAVSLTAGGMQACESVRGTSACGRGPGLALLLAITGVLVLLGSAVLRALRHPGPLATGLLGVGLLAVVVLALADHVFETWMAAAVPALGAAAYALSHAVVTHANEPAPE